MVDRTWTEPLPILAWLIEHPEGLIAVDTGETARASEPGYFPRWHPYFRFAIRERVRPEDEIGPGLTSLGFSPRDVRWVILTHLHTDHAGGLEHFPDSEILVCRSEYENARGFGGQLRGFLSNQWPEWFSPRLFELAPQPFGPFLESYPVTEAGDVTVVATRGHTPGHVSVVLDEGDASVLFAGDASYTQELMLEGAVDGVAPDERLARDTIERVRQFTRERPVVYLPSHDPEAGRRLAARQVVPGQAAAAR
jgi:glyoxylase-like metal-dependent hydrolase (beta-lactamase superfamily II)